MTLRHSDHRCITCGEDDRDTEVNTHRPMLTRSWLLCLLIVAGCGREATAPPPAATSAPAAPTQPSVQPTLRRAQRHRLRPSPRQSPIRRGPGRRRRARRRPQAGRNARVLRRQTRPDRIRTRRGRRLFHGIVVAHGRHTGQRRRNARSPGTDRQTAACPMSPRRRTRTGVSRPNSVDIAFTALNYHDLINLKVDRTNRCSRRCTRR